MSDHPAGIGTNANLSGTPLITMTSPFYAIIPVALLIIALASTNLLLLDYVHVMFGALWTGIDIFMGLVIGRILAKVSIQFRVEFIRRLVPIMLFLMPALASVTVTAGIYLAQSEGVFNLSYYTIITAGIIVILLIVQGIGIFLRNELIIFLELRKSNPDFQRISRLGMINFNLSGVQAVLQIAIIFVMASIASGSYNF
ncbi:MAG: hypothetical protein M1151_00070 [Candidatus Thermoplasmatota archaeon]|jgi:hypothetical protein|nr:hypothetical protein [Candidatus Thermoplasmatota archaeon]MCL5785052.1 hypothetical protein [Candidatus Thermoplasmatota archaeon]